jgi:hypothetical protein
MTNRVLLLLVLLFVNILLFYAVRSSQTFIDEHIVDSDEAMSRFRHALTKGVLVRRHQAGKFAEVVSIFASGGDFYDVRWEAEALAMSRHSDATKIHIKNPNILIIHDGDNPNEFNASSLYKCVRVCGCGDAVTDDISTIQKENDQNK